MMDDSSRAFVMLAKISQPWTHTRAHSRQQALQMARSTLVTSLLTVILMRCVCPCEFVVCCVLTLCVCAYAYVCLEYQGGIMLQHRAG